MINELKEKYGRKCSGVNINGIATSLHQPTVKVKLCEALKYSFDVPIQIDDTCLGCPGAQRSVGFNNDDLKLSKIISDKNDIPLSFITDALMEITTVRKNKITRINLGVRQEMEDYLPPDLFIMYVHPSEITVIEHLLAKHKIQCTIPTYSLLSICGNIFANSLINQLISISFGCPESRMHGGVEDNEVIVGIPKQYAELLLDS